MMSDLIFTTFTRSEEVLSFETSAQVYAAHTARGRYEILRCRSLQPQILNQEDFCTYLWAQTQRGFFLFRQRFTENRPGVWTVWLEIIPEDAEGFFEKFLEYLEISPALLTQGGLTDAQRN